MQSETTIMTKDPFCSSIVNDHAFFESKHFFVLYNIRPLLPGHSLVVSKRHVIGITDLSANEFADLRIVLKKVIPGLGRIYGDGRSYNFDLQVGKASGRSIDHLHIHLIPRKSNDKYQGSDKFYKDIDRGVRTLPATKFATEVAKLRRYFRYTQK